MPFAAVDANWSETLAFTLTSQHRRGTWHRQPGRARQVAAPRRGSRILETAVGIADD